MNLQDTINKDLIASLKAKEKEKVSVLRMLQSSIKNKKIEIQADLEDKDILKVIKSLVKQRKDSIKSYQAGGRNDLVESEEKEIEVLQAYLPEEISDEKLENLIKSELEDAGISEKKDMGKAMGAAMKAVGDSASGDRVKGIVLSILK